MRTDILERKAEILQWIKEQKPKSYMAKQLKCKQETLNNYLAKMNIQYAGQQNKIGQQKGPNTYKPAYEYLGTNKSIKSSELKYKLIKDGLKEYKCECCGLTSWLNEEIPLELHHKDGNHYNNNLNNLLILCPNCHALAENRQTKKDFEERAAASRTSVTSKTKTCKICGKPITNSATLCENCYHQSKKGTFTIPLSEMPISREELKALIRTIPFEQIGKRYGVSGKSISKWCIKFDLPSRKTDIKTYSDEEWKKI